MRSGIAVFICSIAIDNQTKILKGILEEAKRLGKDSYVFTCHINYLEGNISKQGAFNIMNLPALDMFEGIVFVKNTIQNDVVEDLERRIRESGTPTVVIDEKLEGLECIGVSSYDGMREIMLHLIKHHGLKRINYVSGHAVNREGQDRLNAYLDSMKEFGLSCEDEQIYWGNYDVQSGEAAVEKFLAAGPLPEAIVCANDNMAIGVMETLVRFGYEVPGDVKVTGFDNDVISQVYCPSLTTVDKKQALSGRMAVDILFGVEDTEQEELSAECIIRTSCGCGKDDHVSREDYLMVRRMYAERTLANDYSVEATRNMISELAVKENLPDLFEAMKKYIVRTDMESFYLCLCNEDEIFPEQKFTENGQLHEQTPVTEYTDLVSVPLAYEGGQFVKYGQFPSGQILPSHLRNKQSGAAYIVSPICYRNWCFGYGVSKNSLFALKSGLFYTWVMNIGIGMENVRKWKVMKNMVDRLNSVWAYDSLTGLYNRAGFFSNAARRLERIRTREEQVYLVFIDLDGLKKVNDTLGHREGDWMISSMGSIIRRTVPSGALYMRYGGDEFVIMDVCESEDSPRMCIERLQQAIASFNEQDERPWDLSASMGSSVFNAADVTDLNLLVEEADAKMYQEKRAKKLR